MGRGGFANSANFVSKYLTGLSFNDFVADFISRSKPVTLAKAGLTVPESNLKTDYIHKELFDRRNRIMHWGKVNYEKADAQAAFAAALAAIAVLRVIDKHKADELDRRLFRRG